MRSDLVTLIADTKLRVSALKENLDGLKEENRLKESKISALEDQVSELRSTLQEKDEKIKLLKLARKVAGGSTDTQGVKRQINDLVTEIDRCIALLNG